MIKNQLKSEKPKKELTEMHCEQFYWNEWFDIYEAVFSWFLWVFLFVTIYSYN